MPSSLGSIGSLGPAEACMTKWARSAVAREKAKRMPASRRRLIVKASKRRSREREGRFTLAMCRSVVFVPERHHAVTRPFSFVSLFSFSAEHYGRRRARLVHFSRSAVARLPFSSAAAARCALSWRRTRRPPPGGRLGWPHSAELTLPKSHGRVPASSAQL